MSGSKKKHGQVVRIRLNVTDCESIRDALLLMEDDPGNYTFSSAVSYVLKAILHGMRKSKQLPTPDGFGYWEAMREFRSAEDVPAIVPSGIGDNSPGKGIGDIKRWRHLMSMASGEIAGWRDDMQTELDELTERLH